MSRVNVYIQRRDVPVIEELRIYLADRGLSLGEFLALMARRVLNRLEPEDEKKLERLKYALREDLEKTRKALKEGKDITEIDPVAKWKSCRWHAYYQHYPDEFPAHYGCLKVHKPIDPAEWCVDCKWYQPKTSERD